MNIYLTQCVRTALSNHKKKVFFAAKALGINHQSISNYFTYKQTNPYLKRYIFKQRWNKRWP